MEIREEEATFDRLFVFRSIRLIVHSQMTDNLTRKTTQFRKLINSNQLEFIMEAHSGLSAKIVEEAGFKGIWGSGLVNFCSPWSQR